MRDQDVMGWDDGRNVLTRTLYMTGLFGRASQTLKRRIWSTMSFTVHELIAVGPKISGMTVKDLCSVSNEIGICLSLDHA